MKRIFVSALVCLLMAVGATAQVTQIDFTNYGAVPAKINGIVQVAAFDYNLSSQFATSFANWNNFSNGCAMNVSGVPASSVIPFSTSAKVLVDDLTTPANNETVAVSAVTNAPPQCAITLSTSNAHTGLYRLRSGTCGLKEAIVIYGGATANYEVGPAFVDRGCTSSTITGSNATGAATGSILIDKSAANWCTYQSNGTNFVLQGCAAPPLAPAAAASATAAGATFNVTGTTGGAQSATTGNGANGSLWSYTGGTGGAGGSSSGTGGAGGAVSETGGAGGGTITGGAGGAASLAGGAGGSGSTTAGAGGAASLTGGAAVTTAGTAGVGGTASVTAGVGSPDTGSAATAGAGGATAIAGGAGGAASTGAATGGAGGAASLIGGAGGGTITGGAGGLASLGGGAGATGSTAGGTGGGLNLFSGAAGSGGTGTNGAINIRQGGAGGSSVLSTSTAGATSVASLGTNQDLAIAASGSGKIALNDGTDATKQVKVQVSGATTGTATTQVFAQTVARTLTYPDASSGVPVVFDCGSTGTGNQTCTAGAANALTKIVVGHSTLSTNAAIITFPNSLAFTSSSTYECVANDVTTRANVVQMVATSSTTATITNTTGGSDVISWMCIGQ